MREDGTFPVVDAHVHVNRFDLMKPACQDLIRQNPTFALMEKFVQDPAALVDHMEEESIEQLWAINYCAQDVMGYGQEVNEWASDYVSHDKTRLKSTGGYDPRHDGDGGDAARRLHELGLIGCKLHPVHQLLSPDAHRSDDAVGQNMAAFYDELQRLGLPVWFHTGTSIFPGADNEFRHVGPVKAVAEDYGALRIILCHGGRPDQTAEAMALMRQHGNVWMDVSSMPPRRIPDWFPQLETFQDRVLWGSDWPGPMVPGLFDNVLNFLGLGYPAEMVKAVLYENANNLLGTVPGHN